MVRSDPANPDSPSTLYDLIAGLAAKASDRQLWALLGSSLLTGSGVLLGAPDLWPVAALAGTLGSIGTWGLLAHRERSHPSRGARVAQRLLVLLGSAFALAAMLALFFGILGPRWML
jgi:hypothetical protein